MRPISRLAGLTMLAIVTVDLLAAPAFAAGRSTPSYAVRIDVNDNGSLLVTERIGFDFGTDQGHGIFRDLLTQRRIDSNHVRRYQLHLRSVTAEPAGTPTQSELSHSGDTTRIRIGSPNKTISGPRTYTVVYELQAALNTPADGPELFWNAIGPDWQYAIGDASVEVHSDSTRRRGSVCYAGAVGSVGGCDARDDGTTSFFHARNLQAGQAMTVVVGFQPGTLHPQPPDVVVPFAWSRAFPLNAGTGAGGLLVAALSFAGLFTLLKRGRDRRFAGSPVDAAMGGASGETVVAFGARESHPVEFEPPEELRPAQMALLINEAVHQRDVTATVIDLAVHGHLRIEELAPESKHAKPDWTLTRLAGKHELAGYEQQLVDALFASGDAVQISELKNTFAAQFKAAMSAIASDGVERGWWKRSPSATKALWVGAGVVAVGASVGLMLLLGRAANLGVVGLGAIPAALGLLVGARTMPARTAAGHALAGRADGFRQLFTHAEAERERFAERTGVFLEYMGYAIAFGCTSQWAKAFAPLAVQPPDWYVSPAGYGGIALFNAASFTDNMASFAATSASTFASTPGDSSSSGFSGGFSGGGGGGGGGGSW